ncbi:MAG: ABC transporter substrate-binding protein [Gammaproteobacteria bacterium]|nr:ABC transporter substrate-binding protein [Gammaproteobacteria bacterium]
MVMYKQITAIFISLVLLLGLSPAMAIAEKGPDQLMEETTEEMLQALRINKKLLDKEPNRIYGLVNEIVIPRFDFVRISAWVLGKHWRRATPQQRGQFVQQFQDMMVNTYATALLEFSDQKMKYLPVRMKEGDRIVMARSQILQTGKQPVALDYRMFHGKKGWKVFDIMVDGVSLVANYRTSFDTEIRQTSMDALIKRLTEHNAKKKG